MLETMKIRKKCYGDWIKRYYINFIIKFILFLLNIIFINVVVGGGF